MHAPCPQIHYPLSTSLSTLVARVPLYFVALGVFPITSRISLPAGQPNAIDLMPEAFQDTSVACLEHDKDRLLP